MVAEGATFLSYSAGNLASLIAGRPLARRSRAQHVRWLRAAARVPFLVRIAAAILARERQGLRPLVPETANRRPRVAG
ncbi:MAG TPA: hypothetical protein DCL34_04320 [Erythrobacter sp.]|nr:hypothetical protein [Erythrobacter sp.]